MMIDNNTNSNNTSRKTTMKNPDEVKQFPFILDFDDIMQTPEEPGDPRILEEYKKAGISDEYMATPNDINEFHFWKRIDKSKGVNKSIDQIYRIRNGRNEYLAYHETLIGYDKLENKITHPKFIGLFNKPEFSKMADPDTGQIINYRLQGHRTIYEIPFSREYLQRILDKDTEETDPQLILQNGKTKYGGFGLHEFLNSSFDKLLAKATNQLAPVEDRVEMPKDTNTNTTTVEPTTSTPKGKLKEVKKGLVKLVEDNPNPKVKKTPADKDKAFEEYANNVVSASGVDFSAPAATTTDTTTTTTIEEDTTDAQAPEEE